MVDILCNCYNASQRSQLSAIVKSYFINNDNYQRFYEYTRNYLPQLSTEDMKVAIHYLCKISNEDPSQGEKSVALNIIDRALQPTLATKLSVLKPTSIEEVKRKEKYLEMLSICLQENLRKTIISPPIENKILYAKSWKDYNIKLSKNVCEIEEKKYDKIIKNIFKRISIPQIGVKNIIVLLAKKEEIVNEIIFFRNTEGFTQKDENKFITSDNIREHVLAITPINKNTKLPVPFLSIMFGNPVTTTTTNYGKYYFHFVKKPLTPQDWLKEGFRFANEFTSFDLYISKGIDIKALSTILARHAWWINCYRHSVFMKFLADNIDSTTTKVDVDSMLSDYFDDVKVEFIISKWLDVIKQSKQNYFGTVNEMNDYKNQLSDFLKESLQAFKYKLYKISTTTLILQIEQVIRYEICVGIAFPYTIKKNTYHTKEEFDDITMKKALKLWLHKVTVPAITTNYSEWLKSLTKHLAAFYTTNAKSFPNRNELGHAPGTARNVDRNGSLRVILILDLIFHTIYSNEHTLAQQNINPYQEVVDKYNE